MSDLASLRSDLPFGRVAVVLSGGGALGAYEAGVLRALGDLALRPAILAGTSAGAVNALAWLAADFRSDPVVRTWREVRAAGAGIRWGTLGLRAGGILLVGIAAFQIALLLLGSPELVPTRRLLGAAAGHDALSALLDVLSWLMVGLIGLLAALLSRPAEGWLTSLSRPSDPGRLARWLGWGWIAVGFVHLIAWTSGLPWPHRFSASVLGVGGLLWFVNRPGRGETLLRSALTGLLPETGGRGLWGGSGRRRLLKRLVAEGPDRVVGGETQLIVTALALDSGKITYFVSGKPPDAGLVEWIERSRSEVVRLLDPEQVVEAVVASSAIPLAFEPVSIGGREFVDPGQFANQPLEAAVASGAEAAIVVLTSPTSGPSPAHREANLFGLGMRLLEIARWRELQAELRHLPESWTRPVPLGQGSARRVCVVAPERQLPGGPLAFDPRTAADLIGRGERDAWRALGDAGWLAGGERGSASA